MTAQPSIKFRAATITTALRSQGVPVAKLDKKNGIRRSGVSVSEVGRAICFEWMDWDGLTDREAGAVQVISALAGYGLTATAVEVRGVKTGMYRIHLAKGI